jgi:site-specific DNA-methyltransferase (adenine-specific)
MKRKLIYGDCLEQMKEIPDKSIDMVLTDPPYGTTACKWDSVIPFEPMWEQLKRITKDNGAICLFGSEPFSSHLRLSNIKMFKHDIIWEKDKPSGFLNAKKYMMKYFEIISLFCKKTPTYYPQLWETKSMNTVNYNGNTPSDNYGKHRKVKNKRKNTKQRYPRDIIKFNTVNGQSKTKFHPTQKPVALLEYLIKTYTLEGETVLDFTMGSGSTGVACKSLNRKFLGIEKDKKYFKIAKQRIENS